MAAKKEKEIRAAMIGYGGAFGMGKGHAQWVNGVEGMRTVAVADPDVSRLEVARAELPGIETYRSIDELLKKSDANLVVIITPHDSHAPLALKALKAGRHVVLEKPMCLTVAEATKLIEAAQAAKVTCTVFHNRRQDGDFLAIKETIEKGLIGEVFRIEAFRGGYGPPGKWWHSDKKISGGAMYDWGAHFVDWILHLKPAKIENVTGFFQKRQWMDVTNEDETEAIIRFEDGAVASLQISSLAAFGKPRWRILGTKGGILDERGDSFKLRFWYEGMMAETQVKYKPTDWSNYYKNLAKHLLEGAPLEVTPESARRVIAVIEAAEKSSKSGQPVKVPFE